MKKSLIVIVLLVPMIAFAQAVAPRGPFLGVRAYQNNPRAVSVPPLPASAASLPDAKYKMTVPDGMRPKVIRPVPFYAPSQAAQPLQFFITWDSLNKKWMEVGPADIKVVYPNTAVMGMKVRLYKNQEGKPVYKDGMEVYELYNLPKPKTTFNPEKSILNFFRNLVP